MNSRRNPRRLVAAVLVGVLAGGGLMATTPAGAEVAQSATTNWKKIWTKKIQPHADARYYKKTDSDARYSTKAETSSALAGVYGKAEADGRFQPRGSYAPAGSSFTKAESDARYAPRQALYRGSYLMLGYATAGGQPVGGAPIAFGATFPSAPVAHYIRSGDPIPVGCSGSNAAPNAAPGHLCVFEGAALNAGSRSICRGAMPFCTAADPFGASTYLYSAGAGHVEVHGTWAARPSGPVVNPAYSPAPAGATNDARAADGAATSRR